MRVNTVLMTEPPPSRWCHASAGRRVVHATGPRRAAQCALGARTACPRGPPGDGLGHLPSALGDRTASRRHCEIVVDPPEVAVRDLGSTNGTFVNGVAV